MFKQVYKNKRVLITGNTGFKGSWLTAWLLKLGAEIIGLSKDIPTTPSMFNELDLEDKIKHHNQDIRDYDTFSQIIHEEKPDFIFHLAAQAIVSESYSDPMTTIQTNTIGTMNLLESLRSLNHECRAVIITSDKAYDNVEWPWGYRETDKLGGKDIYSGSKGAAELIINSYQHCFFQENHPVKFSVGRAGNVIGGGDWAVNRIVVDCVKSWNDKKAVEIRSPSATRPWQHVLEPLSGYLTLGQQLTENNNLHGEAFNFGPRSEQNRTVLDLLKDLSLYWDFNDPSDAYTVTDNIQFLESELLKLNCDKALLDLSWESSLNYDETIKFIGEWYRNFYYGEKDNYQITLDQIASYENLSKIRKRNWVD